MYTFELPNTIGDSSSNFSEILPVRVKDVIIDESHLEYPKYGKTDSIGVIKYTFIDSKTDTKDTTTLLHAFPLSTHQFTLPLVNEIVLLLRGPKGDSTLEMVDYYLPTLAIFNDINYIPSIDTLDSGENKPGYEFKENNKQRPLHPHNGDTLIQGRLGHSIRFTGAPSPKNTLTDSTNINKPITIISNGHPDRDINSLYVEDINIDDSSIYLTSEHTIPLEQSREKYDASKKQPIKANSFKGKQIILNSGRLFFNADEESILFSAKQDFGVTANNIYIDAVNYIGLDANKIYLGKASKDELQPVILGRQLETYLETLLETLKGTGSAMKTAKTIDGKIIPDLNLAGVQLEEISSALLKWTDPGGESLLKSKKVYTE